MDSYNAPCLPGVTKALTHEVEDDSFLFFAPTTPAELIRTNAELLCTISNETVARNNRNSVIKGHPSNE